MYLLAIFLIGLYFVPLRFDVQRYAEIIENDLPMLLKTVSSPDSRNNYLSARRTPTHSSRQIKNILDAHFPNRWIGHDRPITWPSQILICSTILFGTILKL